jgi:hypothetical protein
MPSPRKFSDQKFVACDRKSNSQPLDDPREKFSALFVFGVEWAIKLRDQTSDEQWIACVGAFYGQIPARPESSPRFPSSSGASIRDASAENMESRFGAG